MNDILKSINLRLNNPFILSFCISWIFWNWPVVVGLIWYNSTTIEKFGYTDYKDLIHQNANPWKNYVLPAAFAIVYPFAKWFFAWIQTWVGSKEEKTIKVVSGKGFIPTSKYLAVIDQYDNDIKKLSDIIESESDLQHENSRLQTEKIELSNSLANTHKIIEEWRNTDQIHRKLADRRIFDGQWEFEIHDSSQEKERDLKILINIYDGKGRVILNNEYGAERLVINDYFCNPYSLRCNIQLTLRFAAQENSDFIFLSNVFWDSTECDILESIVEKDEAKRKKMIYFKLNKLNHRL